MDEVRTMTKEGINMIASFSTAAMVAIAGVLAPFYFAREFSDRVNIKVLDKKAAISETAGKKSEKFMIVGDGEVFQNSSCLLKLKFNPSSLQDQLQEGKSYDCEVFGIKLPELGIHRNIVSCEECTPTQG